MALVCGPPPDGYARWTVRVTTEETKRRGIVAEWAAKPCVKCWPTTS